MQVRWVCNYIHDEKIAPGLWVTTASTRQEVSRAFTAEDATEEERKEAAGDDDLMALLAAHTDIWRRAPICVMETGDYLDWNSVRFEWLCYSHEPHEWVDMPPMYMMAFFRHDT
jgi:hypothetical protein